MTLKEKVLMLHWELWKWHLGLTFLLHSQGSLVSRWVHMICWNLPKCVRSVLQLLFGQWWRELVLVWRTWKFAPVFSFSVNERTNKQINKQIERIPRPSVQTSRFQSIEFAVWFKKVLALSFSLRDSQVKDFYNHFCIAQYAAQTHQFPLLWEEVERVPDVFSLLSEDSRSCSQKSSPTYPASAFHFLLLWLPVFLISNTNTRTSCLPFKHLLGSYRNLQVICHVVFPFKPKNCFQVSLSSFYLQE